MERSKITLGWVAALTIVPEKERTRILPQCSPTPRISNNRTPQGLAMLQNKQLKSLTGWREYHRGPACCAPHPPAKEHGNCCSGTGRRGPCGSALPGSGGPRLCPPSAATWFKPSRGAWWGWRTFPYIPGSNRHGQGVIKIPRMCCEWLRILDSLFVCLFCCFLSSFYVSGSGINQGFLKFWESGNHNYCYSLRMESFAKKYAI